MATPWLGSGKGPRHLQFPEGVGINPSRLEGQNSLAQACLNYGLEQFAHCGLNGPKKWPYLLQAQESPVTNAKQGEDPLLDSLPETVGMVIVLIALR